MQIKHVEPIVDATVAKLRRGMAERVSAINQDGTLVPLSSPLLAPVAYYTSGAQSIPVAPAIIVAAGPSEFGEWAAHGYAHEPSIGVFILEADADRQALGRRLMRQARAVLETLWDDDPREALSGVAVRIAPTGTRPGRVFEPETDDAWRGFYTVQFNALAYEGE